MLAQRQKQAVDLAIAMNPTSITITRTEYTAKDGGREKKTSTVKEQTIMLYPLLGKPKQATEDTGRYTETAWSGLAPSTANIKHGPNLQDSFTISGLGTFDIIGVTPIKIGTSLSGYKLEIRMVA